MEIHLKVFFSFLIHLAIHLSIAGADFSTQPDSQTLACVGKDRSLDWMINDEGSINTVIWSLNGVGFALKVGSSGKPTYTGITAAKVEHTTSGTIVIRNSVSADSGEYSCYVAYTGPSGFAAASSTATVAVVTAPSDPTLTITGNTYTCASDSTSATVTIKVDNVDKGTTTYTGSVDSKVECCLSGYSVQCRDDTSGTEYCKVLHTEDVFHRPMAVVPYGFILPFKTNGGIALVDISDNATLPYNTNLITDDSTGQWFYHRVLWHDMNGDGLKDAVTCRAREPIFGSKASQLVWLEHPAGSVSSPWKPHVLMQGPDIFFRYVTLNTSTGPIDCIITAQFFTKSLSVYWTTDVNKDWTDPSKVKSRVIDNTIGGVFEVVVTDVNSDGKVDLLVTNNGNNGSVFVYEIPSDFRTGNFVRHIIATGFSPLHEGQGKGAPGALLPVFFQQGQKFPVILLSGDDNGSAYILQKKVPQSTDWSYLTVPFYTSGGDTLGEIAIADIDGDGFKEVVIPSYSTSEVVIFTSKNSTVQFP